MSATSATVRDDFAWQVQPAAAAWVARIVSALMTQNAALARLSQLLRDETGTRLVDWIDHLALAETSGLDGVAKVANLLDEIGYVPVTTDHADVNLWRHPLGMFPPVRVDAAHDGLALRVESVDDALAQLPAALGLPRPDDAAISGQHGGPFRQVILQDEGGVRLWLTERHGYAHFHTPKVTAAQIQFAEKHRAAFCDRRRAFATLDEGYQYTSNLFTQAAAELGRDWACDLFFSGERTFWQSRNRAARVQFERQNKLGFGWANHDHHTYRSSRRAFRPLIAFLEQMGFQCRERFYAGCEAGWGAQVLEQPEARVVIFADVDLSPDEVMQDFAHEPLEDRHALGTVGLWCELHGEAFFEAGMHHLECQFDFDAARAQLAKAGVETLAPFTDFTFLRQAFTKGEIWPVEPARVERLLAAGRITAEQAERFRRDGVLSSHLEILERNDGYKGFNQTGISDIIQRTDPRRVLGA